MGTQPKNKWAHGPTYPLGKTFGEILEWHLVYWGTGNKGHSYSKKGKPWKLVQFCRDIHGKPHTSKEEDETYSQTLRNWREGKYLPENEKQLNSILRVLFGDIKDLQEWKSDLERAWRQERDAKAGVTTATVSANIISDVQEPPTHFLGRDEDIRSVREALLSSEGSVAILVHGIAGIGKTTLTRAVAYDPAVIERFGDRRWFAALETAKTTDQMKDAIVLALGGDRAEGLTKTLDRIAQHPGLLILDNLETPWEPKDERRKTEAVLAMLANTPELTLLASFRGAERISRPAWTLVHALGQLEPEPSRELFCRISHWQDRDDPIFKEFVADLDGLPLAIELVAHRAFQCASLEPLWQRWKEIGAKFAAYPDLDPDHVTSLAASIELSLESPRMSAVALRLFSLLGQCPAGLAHLDQQAILGDLAYDASDTLRRVGLAIGDVNRVHLLSPIRRYATIERRPSFADENALVEHFLELVRTQGAAIGNAEGGDRGIKRLVPEFSNVETALSAALDLQRRDLAMATLPSFGQLTRMAHLPSQALRKLAVACGAEGDVPGEALCITKLGDISFARSDYTAACLNYEEAQSLYRNLGDILGEADSVKSLGDISYNRYDRAAAQTAYEEALSLYRKAGSLLGEANCTSSLGDIFNSRYDRAAARTAYEEALSLYRRIGDILGEASCIKGLGDISDALSDHPAAHAAYEQALSLYRKVGNLRGEADCIKDLGEIALHRYDYDAARAAYEQALPLYRNLGELLGEVNCVVRLGDLALRRFDYATARTTYEQALPLHRKIGDRVGEANCIARIGDIAFHYFDLDAARTSYENALLLYRETDDLLGEANCIAGLGDISFHLSEHAAARSAYELALSLYRKTGDLLGEANSIKCLGNVANACSNQRPDRAATEQALTLNHQVGATQNEVDCAPSLEDSAHRHTNHEAARVAYEEALTLYRQIGDLLGEADCIKNLGDIALARSDHYTAELDYREALHRYSKIGSPLGEASCSESLGDIALHRGDYEVARTAYEHSLRIYRKIGDPRNETVCVQKLEELTPKLRR